MSTTETVIGELDVVTLREAVDGFPVGTRGAVVSAFPTHMWVEVVDESNEWGYVIVSVSTEKLSSSGNA